MKRRIMTSLSILFALMLGACSSDTGSDGSSGTSPAVSDDALPVDAVMGSDDIAALSSSGPTVYVSEYLNEDARYKKPYVCFHDSNTVYSVHYDNRYESWDGYVLSDLTFVKINNMIWLYNEESPYARTSGKGLFSTFTSDREGEKGRLKNSESVILKSDGTGICEGTLTYLVDCTDDNGSNIEHHKGDTETYTISFTYTNNSGILTMTYTYEGKTQKFYYLYDGTNLLFLYERFSLENIANEEDKQNVIKAITEYNSNNSNS